MVSLKIVPILALAMGLSTFAFAGDKSAKADNSKADNTATAKVEAAATPIQADAKADEDGSPYTYYVTGESTDINGHPTYTVVDGDPGCDGGSKPCKISSTQQKDANNQVLQSNATPETFQLSY